MVPDTIGVIESTACGFNHFFDMWQRAVEGAEDPETGIVWTPLFYGWQDNPFNALPFISDRRATGSSARSGTRTAAATTRRRGWSSSSR
jgi:hypothetical protein